MLYYKEFKAPVKNIKGKKKKYDNNIYSFDIETTSYFILNGKQHNPIDYDSLDEKTRKQITPQSTMYIWMFGVNDSVYYGRTWDELRELLQMIETAIPEEKILFIHNLSFEFQYLYSEFEFSDVFARKSHKVMKAFIQEFNFELRCTYFMSNVKLEKLADIYNLPVEKLVGNLDYSKIRHSKTPLTEQELAYCENDILVIYYYIKFELETYERIDKIPFTSTGHIRKEFKEKTRKNYSYKARVKKAINTDPHVYNLLVQAFMGGYTHANYIYADEVLKNIDSYDETSAYPYVMVTHKFPSTKFKKCDIKSRKDMIRDYAYLLHIKFYNVKSKLYNNFISSSKCINLKGAKYDNGRIISADEFEMIITDIDFYLYFGAYDFEYQILESYYSIYNYLPLAYINYVLDRYVYKTEYKGVFGKEIEYQLEKAKLNGLYGMSVTNNIRDDVVFENNTWIEKPISNDEIIEKLEKEEKDAFLSFSYGVWVTAHARANLLKRVIDLDKYVIYCDTDSIKLYQGYDKSILENYNKTVENRINYVSKKLGIDIKRFAPSDKKGIMHMLGLFELETEKGNKYTYDEFITQGAKKYAYKSDNDVHITVAGVPKKGSKALNDLNDFKDGFIFKYEDTEKNLLVYCDNQEKFELTDYLGNKYTVSDKSGCCLLPNSYTLGKSYDYMHLLTDEVSNRAIYREVG